jgi:hypothetical protein
MKWNFKKNANMTTGGLSFISDIDAGFPNGETGILNIHGKAM